jgi:hypothetical protein
MANPNYPPELKTRHFEAMESNYISKLRDRVCSEMEIIAEPTRAREIALEETRLALDLLRYAILFLYKRDRPRAIGVLGDVTEDSRVTIAIQTDKQDVNFGDAKSNHTLALTDETVSCMTDIGVFELSDLICKQDKTDFEKVIMRAVHWLASAQTQNENGNALLNLVTSLETFFKAEAGTPITATISEGVAFLTSSGVDDRRERKRRVASFYEKRSKLTHEGDALITDSDIHELTLIARDLTITMIRNQDKFRDHKQFKNWLEDQKLSAIVCFPTRAEPD